MTDKFSKETRTKNMKAIRSKGTLLEQKVAKELWNRGMRFRKNVHKLLGCPDIAIQKHKIVIFIDSCFWHSCPQHGRMPSSNTDYWAKKLNRNRQRDKEVTEAYLARNWNVIRIWEHELRNDFDGTIDRIMDVVERVRKEKGGNKDDGNDSG
jgi:DNA mismatch endonuclease, patch repair protein